MKLKDKKLFLLDMDGTIYLGNQLYKPTIPFLSQIKKNQASYLFVTNNSSKSAVKYVEKLQRLGIESTTEDFLTSTYATILYCKKHHKDDLIYALGTRSFCDALRNAGLHITTTLCDGIQVLLMGFDTELTFQKLEDACQILKKDVAYIATNPDLVCPTEYGYVPDCGSISQILKTATGKYPTFIGKPMPDMILLAMEKMQVTKEETVVIGDRLYTDIASGIAAGVDTIFVLSGEGTLEDLKTRPEKPTYIVQDIGEVLEQIK